MATGSQLLLALVLLFSVFQPSYNRNVFLEGSKAPIRHKRISELQSRILDITLPEGIKPENVNVSIIQVKTCVGFKEQLEVTNRQLIEKTKTNSKLLQDVSGFRSDVRQLKLQLAACNEGATTQKAIIQVQLERMLSTLERISSNNTYLTMRITQLTNEVNLLREKAANSTRVTVLQKDLEKKDKELTLKKQQLERSESNWQLIIQIVNKQSEIWKFERDTKTGLESSEHISQMNLLQKQLEDMIKKLGSESGDSKFVFEIISVKGKIAELQKEIAYHIALSTNKTSDVKAQLLEKNELLKEKIMLLLEDNDNVELTEEIRDLQVEIDGMRKNLKNQKSTFEAIIAGLRINLVAKEEEIKQLQKQGGSQAQLIEQIVAMMKELRDLPSDESVSPSDEVNAIKEQLRTQEKECKTAWSKVKDLEKQLKTQQLKCSGLEAEHQDLKVELNEKIEELKRTGDNSNYALVVQLIELNEDIKALRTQISSTEDQVKITKLEKELRVRNQEFQTKDAELRALTPNRNMLLQIIERQSEIWDLQKGVANETNSYQIEKLQKELDGLITGLVQKGTDNTKLMLKILTLENQVENLKKQLLDLNEKSASQLPELMQKLAAKIEERREKLQLLKNGKGNNSELLPQIAKLTVEIDYLQKSIKEAQTLTPDGKIQELTELLKNKEEELQSFNNQLLSRDRANVKLSQEIVGLQKQLRIIQNELAKKGEESSTTVADFKKQLKIREEENSLAQAQIKDLQAQLIHSEKQCTGLQESYESLQTDLDKKVKELEQKSDTLGSLVVQVSTLTGQVEDLKTRIMSPEAEAKISELQDRLNTKTRALETKTKELEEKSAQPQRLLRIIAIQTEIATLQNGHDTNYSLIDVLEKQRDTLINGIEEERDGNTQLLLKIMTLQDEMLWLKKQTEELQEKSTEEIEELSNMLKAKKQQLADKTKDLERRTASAADLTPQIMELREAVKRLERELSELQQAKDAKIAELQGSLRLKTKQYQDSAAQLRDADSSTADLMLEITGHRKKLKKLQEQASEAKKAASEEIKELQKQLKAKEMENARLEARNKELENNDCAEVRDQCNDREAQLERSQGEVRRLEMKLREEEAASISLEQDLKEKERDFEQLKADQRGLREEKQRLEKQVNDLQGKLAEQADKEDETIIPSNVALDPATANGFVLLSADNTAVSILKTARVVHDHPGRFDPALAVLGETGYSKGRHYWEMNVSQKTCWNIGVASESAKRKGEISLRPSKGYWTLTKAKSQLPSYLAMDERATPIQLQNIPIKLGVLVDYKKGQISFYNAGTREHLHSFTGQTFTDLLYPFIFLCHDPETNMNPISYTPVSSVSWIQ